MWTEQPNEKQHIHKFLIMFDWLHFELMYWSHCCCFLLLFFFSHWVFFLLHSVDAMCFIFCFSFLDYSIFYACLALAHINKFLIVWIIDRQSPLLVSSTSNREVEIYLEVYLTCQYPSNVVLCSYLPLATLSIVFPFELRFFCFRSSSSLDSLVETHQKYHSSHFIFCWVWWIDYLITSAHQVNNNK